jgi:hypothetical protein
MTALTHTFQCHLPRTMFSLDPKVKRAAVVVAYGWYTLIERQG